MKTTRAMTASLTSHQKAPASQLSTPITTAATATTRTTATTTSIEGPGRPARLAHRAPPVASMLRLAARRRRPPAETAGARPLTGRAVARPLGLAPWPPATPPRRTDVDASASAVAGGTLVVLAAIAVTIALLPVHDRRAVGGRRHVRARCTSGPSRPTGSPDAPRPRRVQQPAVGDLADADDHARRSRGTGRTSRRAWCRSAPRPRSSPGTTYTVDGARHDHGRSTARSCTSRSRGTSACRSGSTLRLNQVLAELGYLPLRFVPTGPVPRGVDGRAARHLHVAVAPRARRARLAVAAERVHGHHRGRPHALPERPQLRHRRRGHPRRSGPRSCTPSPRTRSTSCPTTTST